MAAELIPTGISTAQLAAPTTPAAADGEDGDFNLLVAGLPRDVDEHVLRAMFEHFGDVKRALVMYKANTAQSRGFGFVLFGHSVAGQRAIDAMDGTDYQGSVLSVRRSKHDGRVEESDKIFARNIPKDVPVDFIVQTFETVLGTKVAITKMTPGSTTAVITVTLRLDSVAVARHAIEKLHLKHFTSFYEALGDVPPLPPVPEGRPAVPEMLVKFAESDQSRNDRQSKNRADRPPAQLTPAAQLYNGAPMPPPPLPAGHAGSGPRREPRATERRSRTQAHHSEWTQQQHQQPMPPSPGHFGFPGHPHYQHHHHHPHHQHHHEQPRQHLQPQHHSPHDARGAPPSYLSGPPHQVQPIPGSGVPPVAMMHWPQGYALPSPGGGMQNYAAVPGGQQGTPGVFFVPIGPPSAGQPHVSPGPPPPGFLPLQTQHPGMPPAGAAGYGGVPMPPGHGAATASPGAQAWPGETTPH